MEFTKDYVPTGLTFLFELYENVIYVLLISVLPLVPLKTKHERTFERRE